MTPIHKDLFEKGLLHESQSQLIDAVHKRKIISVYYELRLVLYLGIMLFTAGLGYIAYQHMSDIGHLAVMLLMALCIVAGSYYIRQKALPYAHHEVRVDHIYFDHILVLCSLLLISLFTYIQVYYELVEQLLRWSSFTTALLFLSIAYRYDNRAILSMGITALAATFGLSISPVNWANGLWFPGVALYFTAMALGVCLVGVGEILARKNIKKHFTFTYQNFGLLLYYVGAMAFLAETGWEVAVAFLLLISAGAMSYYTWWKKEFLLFLYSSVAFYVAFSYLLIRLLMIGDSEGVILMIYYFPASAIGYVVFLVRHKNHFSHD